MTEIDQGSYAMWYALHIERDGDSFLVTAPDFPEVTTFGDSEEEWVNQGRLAIEEAIAARMADRLEIPAPSRRKGSGTWVNMRSIVFLKSFLYARMLAKGWTVADLMRAMGVSRTTADRLLDLNHSSKIEQFDAAFEALGEEIPFEEGRMAA